MSSVTLVSLFLFFQLDHRQNKDRIVLVSGANGVSIAATLVSVAMAVTFVTLVGLAMLVTLVTLTSLVKLITLVSSV